MLNLLTLLAGCGPAGIDYIDCDGMADDQLVVVPEIQVLDAPAESFLVRSDLTLHGTLATDVAVTDFRIEELPITRDAADRRNWTHTFDLASLQQLAVEQEDGDRVTLDLVAHTVCEPEHEPGRAQVTFRVEPDGGVRATDLSVRPQLGEGSCFAATNTILPVDLCASGDSAGAEVTLELGGGTRGSDQPVTLLPTGPAGCDEGQAGATTFVTVQSEPELRVLATAPGGSPIDVRVPTADEPSIRQVTTTEAVPGRTVLFEVSTAGNLSSCQFLHDQQTVLDGIRVGPVGGTLVALQDGQWSAAGLPTCATDTGDGWTLTGAAPDQPLRVELVLPVEARGVLRLVCEDALGQQETLDVEIEELPAASRPVTGLTVEVVAGQACYAADDERLRLRVCASADSAGGQVRLSYPGSDGTAPTTLLPSEPGCPASGASVYVEAADTTAGLFPVEATANAAIPASDAIDVVASIELGHDTLSLQAGETRLLSVQTEGWVDRCEVVQAGVGELSVRAGPLGGALTPVVGVVDFEPPTCAGGSAHEQDTLLLELTPVDGSSADTFWVTCTDVVGQSDTVRVDTPEQRELGDLTVSVDAGPSCFVGQDEPVSLLACAGPDAAGLELDPSWSSDALLLADPYVGCDAAGVSDTVAAGSTQTFVVTGEAGATAQVDLVVSGPPVVPDDLGLAAGETRSVLVHTDGWLAECVVSHPGAGGLQLASGRLGQALQPATEDTLVLSDPPACHDFEPAETWVIELSNPELGPGDVYTVLCTDGIGQSDSFVVTAEPGTPPFDGLGLSFPVAEAACFLPSASLVDLLICAEGASPGSAVEVLVEGGEIAGSTTAEVPLQAGIAGCPEVGALVPVAVGSSTSLRVDAIGPGAAAIVNETVAGGPVIEAIGSATVQTNGTIVFAIESPGLQGCTLASPILDSLTVQASAIGQPPIPIPGGTWTPDPTCDGPDLWLFEVQAGSEEGGALLVCSDLHGQLEEAALEVTGG